VEDTDGHDREVSWMTPPASLGQAPESDPGAARARQVEGRVT
jgi:hypothetical protein